MNYNNLHYKIALTLLNGIGPVKAKEILSRLNSVERLFSVSAPELSKITELKQSIIQKMNREEALLRSTFVVEHLNKNKISTFYFEDDNYPRRLLQCVDAPLLLYGKVNVDLNSQISANYGIRNIPTLLYFKNGEVVDKQVGVVPKSALAAKLDAQM